MEEILLASASPRRAELLRRMGVPFSVRPAQVDEEVSGEPEACVRALARRKAEDVAARAGRGRVLAADTLVFLDGKALGKPRDGREAAQMLAALSGRAHEVLTGMCLMDAESGARWERCDRAVIHFGELTKEEIEEYVATGEPMDKAGAYGIQGYGSMFVSHLDGDYFCVMGLPVCTLAGMLRDAGVRILGQA